MPSQLRTQLYFSCTLVDATVGHTVTPRSSYDDDVRLHTFVDSQSFSGAGVVRSISLHAGYSDRPLRVGVYREEAGLQCNYRLLQQVYLPSAPAGVNTVSAGYIGTSVEQLQAHNA